MSVTIIRGDITTMQVDAIVNAANNELRGGGGVDGAIHAAAGAEQLHAFCKTLGGCPTGEAKLSPGFNLPAKYIIHTVGPVWQGGSFHEKTLLTSCYLRSLELAQRNNCKTVAFPLISAGAYGYPYDDALQIAYDTCQRFLTETKADMEIYIVLYQRGPGYVANVRRHTAYSEFPDAVTFRRVAEYISKHYHFDAEEAEREEAAEALSAKDSLAAYHEDTFFAYDIAPDFEDIEPPAPKKRAAKKAAKAAPKDEDRSEEHCLSQKILHSKKTRPSFDAAKEEAPEKSLPAASAQSAAGGRRNASSMLRRWFDEDYQPSAKLPKPGDFLVEETFTQMLIRFMREKNLEPPKVYNDACLDRKLFSKILSNVDYQPKKYTAVRLALGLKLSEEETDKLLNAAGFALSRSKLTDLVISYCISTNKRDVWEVNGILEDFGLTTI